MQLTGALSRILSPPAQRAAGKYRSWIGPGGRSHEGRLDRLDGLTVKEDTPSASFEQSIMAYGEKILKDLKAKKSIEIGKRACISKKSMLL